MMHLLFVAVIPHERSDGDRDMCRLLGVRSNTNVVCDFCDR